MANKFFLWKTQIFIVQVYRANKRDSEETYSETWCDQIMLSMPQRFSAFRFSATVSKKGKLVLVYKNDVKQFWKNYYLLLLLPVVAKLLKS